MQKIIHHPIVDAILTFIIAYLLMFYYWILGDLLLIYLPELLGIDLWSIMGEDLYYTWYVYFSFIAIWICGLIIVSVFKGYRPILKAFSPKLKGNNIKSGLIGGLTLGLGLNLLIAFVAIVTGAIEIHFAGLGLGTLILMFISVLIQSGAE